MLNIVGGILELIGIMLMANIYLKTYDSKLPRPVYTVLVLFSALWGGKKAQGAIGAAEILSDNLMISLRGLSFIGLGFLLQLASNLQPYWSLVFGVFYF